MLINKRPTHPTLDTSEKLIESWRSEVVAELGPDPEIAVYLLVLAACGSIRAEVRAATQAGVPDKIEHLVRNNLFALQFGLKAVKGFPSPRKFNEENVAGCADS